MGIQVTTVRHAEFRKHEKPGHYGLHMFLPKMYIRIPFTKKEYIQGRNQLFISGGGNFYELSFDDAIVFTQP